MTTLTIKTKTRIEMVDITYTVTEAVNESGIKNGLCVVFVPHTTAAVTINENADPEVQRDILTSLSGIVPFPGNYRHREGNADAHIKASLMGASQIIIIENGKLLLGTWQALFFCEFDGPRTRRVIVKALAC
jgi:secondary thiamine-phosphate synthase enzyme